MAGRLFSCLEECAILLPRHWEAVQQYGVELPSCDKLTYHGYPITTVRYFHVPQIKEMELGSPDCTEQRVYRQLHHLCTFDGKISKLTILHLTLQCSEQVFHRVLKYMGPLQELVLSIAYPSVRWQSFLESLAAKPSTKDWPAYQGSWLYHEQWKQWCTTQTWHTNVLPHLKYLGIQCPKGFSQSECLETCPILRLVAWTRAQMTPPLEHLKVWEGRGTTDDIVIDYVATHYLGKTLGISDKGHDYGEMVIRGMVTKCLLIDSNAIPLLQLHSTVLFRLLEALKVINIYPTSPSNHDFEILIVPCLEQIQNLQIVSSSILENPLKSYLPLVSTLQWLKLQYSAFSWMLGRRFKALREFQLEEPTGTPTNQSGRGNLQVDLPECKTLKLGNFSANHLHFLSCPNVQKLQLQQAPVWSAIDKADLRSLRDFLCNHSYLQKLDILFSRHLGLAPLIQFVFCDALEQGVWRYIRSVEMRVWFPSSSKNEGHHFFIQMVGQQRHYEKWWKEFIITKDDSPNMVIVMAST